MSTRPVRVLLVDDDRQEFVLLQGLLSLAAKSRYELSWEPTWARGLAALKKGAHDVYLIDYRLDDDRNGLDLLRAARAEGCDAPIILLTGLWDTSVDQAAIEAGASDYLVKGHFDPDVLARALRYAIERRKAVAALRESEEKYRTLVEGARAPYFLASLDGVLEETDRWAAEALGLPPERLAGRPLVDLVHAEDRERVASKLAATARDGEPRQAEFRLAGPKERWWFAVLTRVERRGRRWIAGVAQDITERRRLEERSLQAEKLSAMGLLAAGIAHELNNPLMRVLGACELAAAAAPKRSKVGAQLETIAQAGRRCQALVRSLLEFARKEEPAAADFELKECVQSALSLVEPAARHRSVRVVRELAAAPLRLRGRRRQLEQVLLNLANNALDAMPKGGTLAVRTRGVRHDGTAHARIEVSDTGTGIPPEIRDRVFEPFFTTKERGRGTGLGLSLVQEIVAKHDGSVEFESRPGRGTTFAITLPLKARA